MFKLKRRKMSEIESKMREAMTLAEKRAGYHFGALERERFCEGFIAGGAYQINKELEYMEDSYGNLD